MLDHVKRLLSDVYNEKPELIIKTASGMQYFIHINIKARRVFLTSTLKNA